MAIDELIELLRQIENEGDIVATQYVTDGKPHELVEKADVLATYCLINGDGTPNGGAMEILANAGYVISKGESDSFGWLTGIIHTKKGLIVYG